MHHILFEELNLQLKTTLSQVRSHGSQIYAIRKHMKLLSSWKEKLTLGCQWIYYLDIFTIRTFSSWSFFFFFFLLRIHFVRQKLKGFKVIKCPKYTMLKMYHIISSQSARRRSHINPYSPNFLTQLDTILEIWISDLRVKWAKFIHMQL